MDNNTDKNLDNNIKEINRVAQELNCLLDVAQTINSTLDLEEVLEKVMTETMRLTGAEAGTLWLIDHDTGEADPRVVKGPMSEKLNTIKLQEGEGLAGHSMRFREPIMVADVLQDPRWSKRIDMITGFKTRSILTAPIVWKELSIGCIQLVNKKDGTFFNLNDYRLLLALTNLSGTVIVNAQLHERQKLTLMSITATLSAAIDARDPYTSGHSARVMTYALRLGKKLGFSRERLDQLKISALLHDIGKIGIPDSLLKKKSSLQEEEYAKIKMHPVIGARIIAQMEPRSVLQEAYLATLHHQEKYDGSGYPDGLKGREIPEFARVIAVADAFDAMTSDRLYRKAVSYVEALGELVQCKETWFDPEMVDCFVEICKKDGITK